MWLKSLLISLAGSSIGEGVDVRVIWPVKSHSSHCASTGGTICFSSRGSDAAADSHKEADLSMTY